MLSPVFQYEEKVEDGKTKSKAGYSLKHRTLETAGALNGIAQGIVRCSRTFISSLKKKMSAQKEFYGGVLNW